MSATEIRKVVLSVIALGASIVLVAFAFVDIPPAPDTTGLTSPVVATPPGPLAIVIGDSITERANDRVTQELVGRGWNTAVKARNGAQIDDLRASIRGAATLDPQALVIELGSNDVGRGDTDDAVGRIQRTLDDVKAVRCVVWVNVTEWTNFFGYDTRRGGPVFNRGLLDAAAMDDRLHVVDYAGLFRPDTPEREAYLRANFDVLLLHPASPDAAERWVTLVGDTVDTACR